MSKKLIAIIGAAVLLVIFGVSTYNSLVDKDEEVKLKWSNLEAQYQRRADLIPNLVNTVKAYATHEEDVYTALADARAKLNSASNPEEYKEATDSFDSALSRLLVVVENYPELKADKNFVALQDELAGTENRLSTARKDYNDIATDYNASIKKFPNVIFAGMFGFEKVDLFEASIESQTAPTVNFE